MTYRTLHELIEEFPMVDRTGLEAPKFILMLPQSNARTLHNSIVGELENKGILIVAEGVETPYKELEDNVQFNKIRFPNGIEVDILGGADHIYLKQVN